MEQVDFITALFGPLTPLVVTVLLGTIVTEVLEWLKAPLVKRYPNLDLWWFLYVNAVLGFLVGWFAEINLLFGVVPNEILGRVLSSVLIGGGSHLIYKVFSKPQPE